MRLYDGVPKNALDPALDIAGTLNCEGSSIVGLLITAGAEMTGNSTNYRDGKSPHMWRRQKGSVLYYGPDGYQGPRFTPQGEAALRKEDPSKLYADAPNADFDLTTSPAGASCSGGEVIRGDDSSDDSRIGVRTHPVGHRLRPLKARRFSACVMCPLAAVYSRDF